MYCDLWISKFKKEQFPRKLYEEVQYPLLCEEFENGKKKEQNFFDLPEWEIEPQIFGNFLAHDLNFHGKRGALDQIKTSF